MERNIRMTFRPLSKDSTTTLIISYTVDYCCIILMHSPKETHQVFLSAKTSLLLEYPWLRLNDGTNHNTPSVVCTYVQYIHTYIHAAGTDQGKPRGRVTSYQSVISKGLVISALRMHVVMSPPLSPKEQRTLAGNRELYAKRPKDKAILSRLWAW